MIEKFKKKLDEFFQVYPSEQSCFLVADGTIFITKYEHYAKRHAKDKGLIVMEVTRAEFEALKNKSPKSSEGSIPSIDEAKLTYEGLDKSMNKDQVMAFAQEKGVQIAKSATKKEWINAILDAQEASEEVSEETQAENQGEDTEGLTNEDSLESDKTE